MTTKTFSPDEEKFLWAIRTEVEDKGVNYIYDQTERGDSDNSCTYVNYRDGGVSPSCLIGRALVRADFYTVNELKSVEGSSANQVVPFDGNSPVATAADQMQGQQDGGNNWGYAYAAGLLYLASRGYDVARFMLD